MTDPTVASTRHPLRRAVAITAVVLAALTVTVILMASSVEQTETVSVPADVTGVEIDLDAGSVTLTAADELAVTITRSAGRFAGTPSSSTDVTDGVLRVTGSCPPLGVGRCHTPVMIAAPPGVTVRAHTGAGSINGEIDRGTVVASTSAGSIGLTVTEQVDHLSATTQAGGIDLVVPDVVYAVDARTSLGRTHIQVDTADDADHVIEARSDVGNISVQTPSAANDER